MKRNIFVLLVALLLAGSIGTADEPTGSQGIKWGIGIGRTVDRLPLTLSKVTFFMSHVYLETPIDNTSGIRYGAVGLGGFIPIPRIEYNKYFLAQPCELIFGAGVFYDFMFGGHGGLTIKTGVRLFDTYEITVDSVPFGTKNLVNYSTLKDLEDGDKGQITFPYYTLTVSARYPL